ncbi:MAG: 4-(cytidine 5'-diphospho)-2-C-methyl-D-erythritol kinase [Candidatus Limnocylindrales bacterium]
MITALAPAKVNLALAITGRRADGFHELVSVFVRVGLADRLSVEVAATWTQGDRLTVDGASPSRTQRSNLVLRATEELRGHLGQALPPLDWTLEKHIPYAAGLAGGSSDGAAALGLATAAWGVALSDEDRLDLAARLGSDVPFFVTHAATALVEGRGERIGPLPSPTDHPAVLLITTATGLSTTAVFAELDASEPVPRTSRSTAAARELAAALEAGLDAEGFAGWAARLRDANDLWAPVLRLRPEIGAHRASLEAVLERPVLLSGSGPTLVALYPSLEAAEAGRERATRRADLHGLQLTATPVRDPAHMEGR